MINPQPIMSSCSKIGPKSSPYEFGLVSSLKIFPLALYPYETFVNPSSLSFLISESQNPTIIFLKSLMKKEKLTFCLCFEKLF